MARLRKTEAEAIMAAIDSPDLVRVLTGALERVVEVKGTWTELIAIASDVGRWSAHRAEQLLRLDEDALVELALELNETRTVCSVA
jgi:hypothetical protein